MRPLRSDLERVIGLVSVALEISACGWTELDAVAPSTLDAEAPDARLLVPDAGDATTHADATNDAGAANDASMDAEVSSLACTRDAPSVDEWTFDSSIEGWSLSLDTGAQGTLAWIGTAGYSSIGAAEVRMTPQEDGGGTPSGGWLRYPNSFGDLTGRTVSAWVWLESGTSPNLKVFAQTGAQYVWSDNGIVILRPRTWTCVSLPISMPSYSQPNYDPTDVINIGFELLGLASFVVYVDTVRIY